MSNNLNERVRKIYIVVGLFLFFCGYCMYLGYRSPDSTVMHTWSFSPFILRLISHGQQHVPWMDWMPSFIHVLAMSLISIGIVNVRVCYRYIFPIGWMIVGSLFEIGQYFHPNIGAILPASWASALPFRYLDNYLKLGTFDYQDIAAGFAGMLVAIFIISLNRDEKPVHLSEHSPLMRHIRTFANFALLLIGVTTILASTIEPGPYQTDVYDPVYLSYSDLRKPVTSTTPAPLSRTEAGKIYLYGNFILYNKRNQGIHVVDNSNPASPINFKFIPVPGNIDIAVKDNILYVDSYIDLVAIDISDVNNIHEVNRVQSIFPYDPFQSISNPYQNVSSYDTTKGIVIGYERRIK